MKVRILRLAAGGDGVGKLEDGRAVFVPRTAPGDLVELSGLREHRRFARARVGALLEAAAERIAPPCPHYVHDDCGGCQLQHLGADAQRAARRTFVGDALRRIGGVETEDPEIVPADRDWNYRTKLTLHMSGGRIGLHPLDRPAVVFDLRTCPITSEPLLELWSAVRDHRRLLPSTLERIVLRLDAGGGRHLIAEVHGTAPWDRAADLHAAMAREGVGAVLWLRPEGGAARAVAGSRDPFPASVFEQVHPAMGARARADAVAQSGAVAGSHAWDLYAGIGDTTLALLDAGATVDSVEADRRAVAWADARGPADRARVVRHAAKVEDVLRELRAPDCVVTNPPRIGMHERVTDALRARAPRRIVYISCDPATLARDVQRLGDGYRLAGVRAFDLFPQTAHVESVVVLDRA